MASLRHRRGIAEDDDVHDDGTGTAPDTDTATATATEEEEDEEEEEEEEEDHRLRLGVHSMTAKGIQHLCSELLEIKKASEHDFRANVYLSYLSFVRMFQEAGDLDKDVHRLRRQAIAHGRLVQHLNSLPSLSSSMLLAAAAAAAAGSKEESDMDMDYDDKDDEAEDEEDELDMMAARMARVAGNPRTPRGELLRAVSGLCRLGDAERANRLLLDWHRARVLRGVDYIKEQSSSGGNNNYIKEVARMVFSSIAQAAATSAALTMHDDGQLLLRWAREEMEDFGAAFSEYVGSVSQLPLALEAAECAVSYAAQLAVVLGSSEQDQVLGLMVPCIQEALPAYARHLKEVVRLLVASDAWVLGRFRVSSLPAAAGQDCLLTTSGRKLVTLLQEVVDDVARPLQRLGMDSAAAQLVADLFREYVRSIPVGRLMDDHQHVSVLINCATLASLFPTIAGTAAAAAAQREAAGQVWDCFCQKFVRDTMMAVSSSDKQQQQQQPDEQEERMMPSLGLQLVFLRVRRLKDAYGAILMSGEDGTMKRLLGELMEAIVSWLSTNMPDSHQAQLDVHFLLEIARLGGVDITASALALLRNMPREEHTKVDEDYYWAADAATHAVQVLSLHNNATTAADNNAEASTAAVEDDDDMASRKSSDEFISIEDDDDQDKATTLIIKSSDNDDAIVHDDDDRASPPTTTTAETGGRSRKKKAAVSTSRPRWQ